MSVQDHRNAHYSTAASVHQAIGVPTAMAIDAGNLLPVARDLRQTYPSAKILIAGDNDVGLTYRSPPLPNVGRDKAEAAAREVCAFVSIPPSDRQSIDWNDVHAAHGLQATAASIRQNLRKPSP